MISSDYRETKQFHYLSILVVFLTLILSGCSQMASQYGIKPAVSYDIRGKVQDDVYVSMDDTYKIRIPPLLKPGAIIKDKRYSDKLNGVAMSDDLCRQFMVFERILNKEESFDMHVEEYLKGWITRSNAKIIEQRKVDTIFGPSLLWHGTIPKAAPCISISFVDGKRTEDRPDADNKILFVQSESRIYLFSYMLGPMEEWPGIKTGPTETVLMEFVAGFKQLK